MVRPDGDETRTLWLVQYYVRRQKVCLGDGIRLGYKYAFKGASAVSVANFRCEPASGGI